MGVTDQLPSVGWIVHYRLTEQDVADAFVQHGRGGINQPKVGDVLPMVIVGVVDESLAVSGNVHLPGGYLLGVDNRGYSVSTNGCWFWPPRV